MWASKLKFWDGDLKFWLNFASQFLKKKKKNACSVALHIETDSVKQFTDVATDPTQIYQTKVLVLKF